MTDPRETDREVFEKWVHGYLHSQYPFYNALALNEMVYFNRSPVPMLWDVWQAAIEHERKPVSHTTSDKPVYRGRDHELYLTEKAVDCLSNTAATSQPAAADVNARLRNALEKLRQEAIEFRECCAKLDGALLMIDGVPARIANSIKQLSKDLRSWANSFENIAKDALKEPLG